MESQKQMDPVPPGGTAGTVGTALQGALAASTRGRWLPWAGIVLVAGALAASLAVRFEPAIVTPDANGYWAQGSLLATTGRTWFEPEVPVQYVGMHWLVTEDGRYFSRYPPGLAVIVAVVYRLFGHEASVLVNPALAVLATIGLFALVRQLTDGRWAVLGAAILAMNPIFHSHALSSDSHMAVTCLLAWGLFLLVRWSRTGQMWAIFGAGILLGAIPTIRYPEALFALGIGVFLLLHWRERPAIWAHYLAAVAGALLPIIPLLIRNHLAFGRFYRTAYALTNEQTGFGPGYFAQHFVQYLQQLPGEGIGLFFALGIVGVAALIGSRHDRRVGWLLLLIPLPTTLLYMAYYWAPSQMSAATLRFLLPTFVAYIAAGVWVLREWSRHLPGRAAGTVVTAIVAIQLAWGGFTAWGITRQTVYRRAVLAKTTGFLDEQVPTNAVIVANPHLLQHLDFVRRWRLVDPTLFRGGGSFPAGRRAANAATGKDTPMPMQLAKREKQLEAYEGLGWGDRERTVAADLRQWAGDHEVYLLATADEISRMRGVYFNLRQFEEVARLKLPAAPPQQRREGMGGAGMGGGPPDGPGGGGQDGPGGMQQMGGPGMQQMGGPGMQQGGPGGMPQMGGPGMQQGGPGMQQGGPGGMPQMGGPGGMQQGGPGGMAGRMAQQTGSRARPGGGMMGYMDGVEELILLRWKFRPAATSGNGLAGPAPATAPGPLGGADEGAELLRLLGDGLPARQPVR